MSISKNIQKKGIIPDQFPFPYEKPYDIQLDFMKALYNTLEEEKVGIFESPTGTVHKQFTFIIFEEL